MERENDVIELGTATAETKGPIGFVKDVVLNQPEAALTDD
ncbi:hypothetical protein EDF57_109117 [Novosphingobium sp. PhB55]|nr:benenodin family lasso peptide [Novosphingobium sp. PhB55]TDW61559.1 hypothetical protein EDF57_109117 [Novosphingobium sp. PhB55]